MKKLTILIFFLLTNFVYLHARVIPPDSLYFGQTPPGSIPQIFAPGRISLPGRNEAVITFSPDGATLFFYIQFYPSPGIPYIMISTYTGNHWSDPVTVPFCTGRLAAEPIFGYNGSRLYMYATNAIGHQGNADLSYSEKQGSSWGTPVSMGDPPNSEINQFHPCLTGDTSVYFSSNAGQVCRSQYSNGLYGERVILPRPVNYIGSQTWGDPWVAPDESYMIIKAIREEGYGENDIYISYKKQDGTWTNPKNLGNIINTQNDETSGDITPDGLYMTYGSNGDLYWVSTSFVDSLKFTNYVPYLKYPMPDQTGYVGHVFTYAIPDSTFFDDDGNGTLSYQNPVLSNGNPLPGWLSFDTATGVFSGTPPQTGILSIKVTITDTASATASGFLKLKLQLPSSTDSIKPVIPSVSYDPSTHVLHLKASGDGLNTAKAEMYDLRGKLLTARSFSKETEIDLSSRPAGIFILRMVEGDEVIIRKFFVL